MYKSQDKAYLKQAHDAILQTVPADQAKELWEIFLKQIYIEDLNIYYRTLSKEPIDYYRGNLASKNVLVFHNLRKDSVYMIEFLKDLLKSLHLDYNNYYVTSLFKANNMSVTTAIDCLSKELNVIKPDQVFVFSFVQEVEPICRAMTSSFGSSVEYHLINPNDILYLINLKKQSSLSVDDQLILQDTRKRLWDSLKNLMKYNSN